MENAKQMKELSLRSASGRVDDMIHDSANKGFNHCDINFILSKDKIIELVDLGYIIDCKDESFYKSNEYFYKPDGYKSYLPSRDKKVLRIEW